MSTSAPPPALRSSPNFCLQNHHHLERMDHKMDRALRVALLLTTLFGAVTHAFLIRRDHGGMQTIPLRNVANKQYSAKVRMGPEGTGQQFNFGLSTTLAYTVVAGKNCSTCTDPAAPRYDPGASSTFRSSSDSSFRSVSVFGRNATGPMGIENCALGTDAGGWWSYKDQRVIVADPESAPGVLPGALSGIAGFGQSAVPANTDSLVGQYFQSHQNVSDITFAVSLRPSTSTDGSDSDGGAIHLFGTDSKSFNGEITTLNAIPPAQQQNIGSLPSILGSFDWTVQMQNWTFRSGQTTRTGGQGVYATIEPAYPYIMLTQAEASQLYLSISGAQRDPATTDSNAYTIPCGTPMELSVSFGGQTLQLDPKDLVTQVGNTCYGNIRGWNSTSFNTYVMGSAFFRSVYVVFTATPSQQNTIGFAPLVISQSSSVQAGVIAASVLGGVLFMALVALGVWLYLRRKRQQQTAPSTAYSSSIHAAQIHNEKSLFGFFSKGHESQNKDLAAEPWTPPQPGNAGGGLATQVYHDPRTGDQLTVGPAFISPEEQALLAPSGHGYSDKSPNLNSPTPLPYLSPTPPLSDASYGQPVHANQRSSQYATYRPTSGSDVAPLSSNSHGDSTGPLWVPSSQGPR